MKKRSSLLFCLLLIFLSSLFCGGCSEKNEEMLPSSLSSAITKTQSSIQEETPSVSLRNTVYEPLLPIQSMESTEENEVVLLDFSNSSKGYIMVDYHGTADKIKLQIKIPDSTTYSYPLKAGRIRSFPLPGGDGIYQITVLEHAYDDLYAVAFSKELSVTLEDEFLPFLYPNQFSWYDHTCKALSMGIQLSEKSSNDLEYLEQVYQWVISNISYDNEKAETVTAEYVPDVDNTLTTKKGICFDYASLMVAMLRSQNIPTKLEVGYSGQVYHAWISVYLTELGWVDGIIEFDGKSWTLMDPTLASNNDKKAVGKYVGDGSNYTVKYHY